MTPLSKTAVLPASVVEPNTAAGTISTSPPVSAMQLDAVTLSLGGRVILRDVDLNIGAGQFIGLLGPNGAGKTTLMRALLGLLSADSGKITVLGQPVARGNRAIGYLPQVRSLGVATRLRGRDFIACAHQGHRWGLPHMNAMARGEVDDALDRVGAKHLAERPLAELSGGERQRLLLAQALLGKPRILLLDEPLISLDPHHQQAVVDLVRQVQREMNLTVLFSAHELNPLLGALDRVLYLGNGAAALGTVDQVITGPVLSRLYGAPIEVIRVEGRIFVMSGDIDIEKGAHQHSHGDDSFHGHAAHHRHDHHADDA
jgi:zinc/manganese transport system ATP-binding protein